MVAAALLVSPVFCWSGAAESAAADEPANRPVPRDLREPAPELRPVEPPRAVDAGAVLSAVSTAASGARGRVEAVVLDAVGRPLVQTPGAAEPVYSASLVKLLVVQQVVARQPGGLPALDPRTVARMERAITASDDAAMNLLWDAFDGDALVRAAATEFGLTGTAPPAERGQWGQTVTTAEDVARFLGALAATPEAPGSAAVLGWMRAPRPVAADGFDQRFGLLTGVAGPGVAAKQGWMCCVDGRRQLHSAGVLADGRVVVALGEAPLASGADALGAALDEATAALVAGTA